MKYSKLTLFLVVSCFGFKSLFGIYDPSNARLGKPLFINPETNTPYGGEVTAGVPLKVQVEVPDKSVHGDPLLRVEMFLDNRYIGDAEQDPNDPSKWFFITRAPDPVYYYAEDDRLITRTKKNGSFEDWPNADASKTASNVQFTPPSDFLNYYPRDWAIRRASVSGGGPYQNNVYFSVEREENDVKHGNYAMKIRSIAPTHWEWDPWPNNPNAPCTDNFYNCDYYSSPLYMPANAFWTSARVSSEVKYRFSFWGKRLNDASINRNNANVLQDGLHFGLYDIEASWGAARIEIVDALGKLYDYNERFYPWWATFRTPEKDKWEYYDVYLRPQRPYSGSEAGKPIDAWPFLFGPEETGVTWIIDDVQLYIEEYFHYSASASYYGGEIAGVIEPSGLIVLPFEAKINFQSDDGTYTVDYMTDTGSVYDSKADGFEYGWDRDVTSLAYNYSEADQPSYPSKVQRSGVSMSGEFVYPSEWEIKVPDGRYRLDLTLGDVNNIGEALYLRIEDQVIIQTTTTSLNPLINWSGNISVRDGKLTLKSGGPAFKNTLVYLELKQNGSLYDTRRYVRGEGNSGLSSYVEPLDDQMGMQHPFQLGFDKASGQRAHYDAIAESNIVGISTEEYDSTNADHNQYLMPGGLVHKHLINFDGPLAYFGKDFGGSPLYVDGKYSYGVHVGRLEEIANWQTPDGNPADVESSPALFINVYDRHSDNYKLELYQVLTENEIPDSLAPGTLLIAELGAKIHFRFFDSAGHGNIEYILDASEVSSIKATLDAASWDAAVFSAGQIADLIRDVVVETGHDFLLTSLDITPYDLYSPEWPATKINGHSTSFDHQTYGLTTKITVRSIINFVQHEYLASSPMNNHFFFIIEHTSSSDDYVYSVNSYAKVFDPLVNMNGGNIDTNGDNVANVSDQWIYTTKYVNGPDAGKITANPLYTFSVDERPFGLGIAARSNFEFEPLPPEYHGKSAEELLSERVDFTKVKIKDKDGLLSTAELTYDSNDVSAVSEFNSLFADINQSPELRQSNILDQFVADHNNDPIALARYVHNEIEWDLELTIPEPDNDDIEDNEDYDPWGVDFRDVNRQIVKALRRNAESVFLQKQGSAMEQCALLVYLLRQAGYSAAYVFPDNAQVKLLDKQLSRLTGIQFQELDYIMHVAPVEFPWVVTYVGNPGSGGRWVHLFPWMKDNEVIEGFDLYDHMPAEFDSAAKWLKKYFSNDQEVMFLDGPHGSPLPEVAGLDYDMPIKLWPAFIKKKLSEHSPHISYDDVGAKIRNRRHNYSDWDDFPLPFAIDGGGDLYRDVAQRGPNSFAQIEFQLWVHTSDDVDKPGENIFATGIKIDTIGPIPLCEMAGRPLSNFFTADFIDRKSHAYSITLSSSKDYDPLNPPSHVSASSIPELPKYGVAGYETKLSNYMSNVENEFKASYSLDGYSVRPFFFIRPVYTEDIKRFTLKRRNSNSTIIIKTGRVTQEMLDLKAKEYMNYQAFLNSNPSVQPDPDVVWALPFYIQGMEYFKQQADFIKILNEKHKTLSYNHFDIIEMGVFDRTDYSGMPIENVPRYGAAPVSPYVTYHIRTNPFFSIKPPWYVSEDILNVSTLESAQAGALEHCILRKYWGDTLAVSGTSIMQIASKNQALSPGPYEKGLIYLTDEASTPSIRDWESTLNTYVAPPYIHPDYPEYANGLTINHTLSTKEKHWINDLFRYTPDAFYNFGIYANTTYQGARYRTLAPVYPHGYGATIVRGDVPFIAKGGQGFVTIQQLANMVLTYSQGVYTMASADVYGGSFNPSVPVVSIEVLQGISDMLSATIEVLADVSAGITAGIGDAISDIGGTLSALVNEQPLQQTVNEFSATDTGPPPDEIVNDPVNIVSGAFEIDEIDVDIKGPFPLEIRRNYNSGNYLPGVYGFGWKRNIVSHLSFRTENTDTEAYLHAAELNGSVFSYAKQGTASASWTHPDFGVVVPNATWKVEQDSNPHLKNRTGGLANKYNAYIDRFKHDIDGDGADETYYVLFGSDGSFRQYKEDSFRLAAGYDRIRPYVQYWKDNRGNRLSFEYGLDRLHTDFGQLRRISSSNGSYIIFTYNRFGRVVEALASDGKRVLYDYDDFGDLARVTRPDGSVVEYEYSKDTAVVNSINTTISTHRLIRVTNPNGRVIENDYTQFGTTSAPDWRVTTQRATVGDDLVPVRNATYLYTQSDHTVTADKPEYQITRVYDAFNHPTDTSLGNKFTEYKIYENLIFEITDTKNQKISKSWFINHATKGYYDAENYQLAGDGTEAGHFARSIKREINKRGLITDYEYDASGNIVKSTITGDITGDGSDDTIATYFKYNNRNLIVAVSAPDVNGASASITDLNALPSVGVNTVTKYHDSYKYLPSEILNYQGNIFISKDVFEYEDVGDSSNPANIYAKGIILEKSIAADQDGIGGATTTYLNNVNGYSTKITQYTGDQSDDADIVTNLDYNSAGVVRQSKDNSGAVTRYLYDTMGRLQGSEVFDENQELMSWEFIYFNANGDVTWTDGPRFDPEDYVLRDYDGGGRLIAEIRWRSQAKKDGTGVEAVSEQEYFIGQSITTYDYDEFGNLNTVVRPDSSYEVMAYDAIGQMEDRTFYDSDGNQIAFEEYEYEEGGMVSMFTDPNGLVTNTTYTDMGRLKLQSYPDGTTQSWEYYKDGRIKKEKLKDNSYWFTAYDDVALTVTKTLYDSSGVIVTDSEGKSAVEIREFDVRGNAVASTDLNGDIFLAEYDDLNRVTLERGPPDSNSENTLQQVTTYKYDPINRSLVTENRLKERRTTVNDAIGRPTLMMLKDKQDQVIHEEHYRYSRDHHSVEIITGNINNLTDFSTKTVSYSDLQDNVVLVQNFRTINDFDFKRNIYDKRGNLIEKIDELKIATQFEYDSLNRRVKTIRPDASVTEMVYDDGGRLQKRIMPGGLTWKGEYKNSGNGKGKIEYEKLYKSDENSPTRYFQYTYDAFGRVDTKIDLSRGSLVIDYGIYDSFGRLESISTSGGTSIEHLTLDFDFDLRGNLKTAEVDYHNPELVDSKIERDYNAYGRIYKEKVFLNNSSTPKTILDQYWDAAGSRSAIKEDGSNLYSFSYDSAGQITRVQEFYSPNQSVFTYDYSTSGLLKSRMSATKSVVIPARDLRGRALECNVSLANGAASILRESNIRWRADSKLESYNVLRAAVDNWEEKKSYIYTLRGQLLRESYDTAAGITETRNYSFDADGLGVLTDMNILNDVVYDSPWNTQSVTLDDYARADIQDFEEGVRFDSTGTAFGADSFLLNISAQPYDIPLYDQEMDQENGDGTWSVPLELPNGTYQVNGYARHGSLQSESPIKTRDFNVTNATTLGSIDNVFDGSGYLTSRTNSDNSTDTFTWDALGRLVKVVHRESGGSVSYDYKLGHDALGRRLQTDYVEVTGGSSGTLSTVISIYDPEVEFLEIGLEKNSEKIWFIYGPDIDGTYGGMQGIGGLEAVVSSSESYTFISDINGHILGSLKDGSITWNNTAVSAYGPVASTHHHINDSGSLISNLIKSINWRGYRQDPTGLICTGARYYDPENGRFISPDPLGHEESMDLYSFANGDPINLVDPTGRGAEATTEDPSGEVSPVATAAAGGTVAAATVVVVAGKEMTDPEWQHQLLQNGSASKLARQAGIDIHDKKWGVVMPKADHRLKDADGLHTKGADGMKATWDNEMNKWADDWVKNNPGKRPTEQDFEDQVNRLRNSDRFKGNFKNAVDAPVDYNQWHKHLKRLKNIAARSNSVVATIDGLLAIDADVDRYERAAANGITYTEQMQIDIIVSGATHVQAFGIEWTTHAILNELEYDSGYIWVRSGEMGWERIQNLF